jgi:hypothetical protein
LGADNTDPGATIPEGDKDWINVTLPTETIFYNKATDENIQSPTYTITNNSGRPVKVSANGFTGTATGLPADFDLNLTVTGNKVVTASTALVKQGKLQAPTNELITLANCLDQYKETDTQSAKDKAVNNKATFAFAGTATAKTPVKVAYTLSLKFDVPTNFK